MCHFTFFVNFSQFRSINPDVFEAGPEIAVLCMNYTVFGPGFLPHMETTCQTTCADIAARLIAEDRSGGRDAASGCDRGQPYFVRRMI